MQAGHELTVITCPPHFPEGKLFKGYVNTWARETIDDIEVLRVPTYITANEGVTKRSLGFASYMIMGFLRGLFLKKADLVVATTPQFFNAIAGWALSRLRKMPFVLEVSDLWPASITAVGAIRKGGLIRLLERMELFLYRQAHGIVALTQAFKDDMVERGIDASKISVVINGVDLSRYRPQPKDVALAKEVGLKDNLMTVGYIGTFGLAHGLENVLETAQALINEPVQFLLVGTGAARAKLEAIASAKALHNVIFVPPQPKERMPQFWSLCDLALVHLSDAPLFSTVIPSKIFEAMGMGLPIVLVARAGEASRIIDAEKAGICVPPKQPLELAKALLGLCHDRDHRDWLRKNSATAAQRYTRQRQADEMLAALGKISQVDKSLPAGVAGPSLNQNIRN